MDAFISFAVVVVSITASLLARIGLQARIKILESAVVTQIQRTDRLRSDMSERNIAMASIVDNAVRQAMKPFLDKLNTQDTELGEIKDMCMYLVNNEQIFSAHE